MQLVQPNQLNLQVRRKVELRGKENQDQYLKLKLIAATMMNLILRSKNNSQLARKRSQKLSKMVKMATLKKKKRKSQLGKEQPKIQQLKTILLCQRQQKPKGTKKKSQRKK